MSNTTRGKAGRLRRHAVLIGLAAVATVAGFGPAAGVLDQPLRDLLGTFRPAFRRIPITTDESGIAMVHYPPPVGERRNPVSICQKALAYWENATALPNAERVTDPDAARRFLNCADWLVAHARSRGDAMVWEYDFDFSDMKAPWISGMAQGHAMGVLVRAHQMTRDERYYAVARAALEAMLVNVDEGGVRMIDPDDPDAWWFAEYPSIDRPRKVLNGMLYALVGLHELHASRGDELALTVFNRGVAAVVGSLPDYDTGRWSRYDALGTPASEGYHRVHVNLLWRLYGITGEETFRKYARKWQDYDPPPRRFSFCKFDLLLAGIVFMAALLVLELAALSWRSARRRRGRPANDLP